MKLIIQIPCLNEAETLPATLADLPTSVPGIDVIETLVIDDGSRDDTAAVARAHGVNHVVRFRRRKGLAAAFMAGIDAGLKAGADFIVNTDADNQYAGATSRGSSAPLLSGQADIVIGDRNIRDLAHMSWPKKLLQRAGQLGRAAGLRHAGAGHDQRLPRLHARGRAADDDRVGVLLHARVDHPGGQEADGDRARRGRQQRAHAAVAPLRQHASRTSSSRAATIVRIYAMYEPLKVFTYIGSTLFLVGLAISGRFLYFYLFTAREAPASPVADSRRRADDRRLPGRAHRPRGRRDLGHAQAARRPALSRALDGAGRATPAPIACARIGSADVAEPGAVSVVIPACNEVGRHRRRRHASWLAAAALARDPRHRRRLDRRHGARAAAAGARVIRHPYNKGNGAAVKSGIRAATGEYVLIIDGDGQHQPADARPPRRARLGEYDLVVGARSSETQAGSARRARQRRAQPAGELPDGTRDSGSHVRIPRSASRRPCSSFSTCCRTDSRRRRPRRSRSSKRATTSRSSPSTRARASGTSKIRLSRDGAEVPADHASRDDDLQSAARVPAGRRRVVPPRRGLCRLDDRDATAHHELLGPAHHARGA